MIFFIYFFLLVHAYPVNILVFFLDVYIKSKLPTYLMKHTLNIY